MKLKEGFLYVVDFEFTCWRGRPPKDMMQEILEIGIIQVNLEGKKITNKDRFLIKPEKSNISKFCTQLTSITKGEVLEKGMTLKDAFLEISNKYNLKNSFWGSWGIYDNKHLINECEIKQIDFPFSDNHIDLQKYFSDFNNKKRLYSVENALELLSLKFEGRPHQAYYDAYNTALIYLSIL